MSSFVWMKVLESSPERYDQGIRILSGGRIDDVYDSIAERAAHPGERVLDIGCGTGNLSLRCAARGANVVGIDISAGMLEVARTKPVPKDGQVEWVEIGVAEIEDHFAAASFDSAVSCLLFSELSVDEQDYTLAAVRRLLRPGAVLVIADEVEPLKPGQRFWQRVKRLPRTIAAYAATQASTRPVEHLADRVRDAGFVDVNEQRIWSDTFVIVSATSPASAP
jgi:demethylmenaquinone methyltransferase/2-methoxy-6-polyprenyl-1,4-benzoquinol methylase